MDGACGLAHRVQELGGIEERLRSRFRSGLVVDVQPPDLETRIAILQMKALSDRLAVPDEVLHFIASKFEQNIRELEGALLRVAAFASLSRQPADLDLAERALEDLLPESGQEIRPAMILEETAAYFGLGPGDLVSDSQAGVVMDLLAGAKVSSLLKRVAELGSGKNGSRKNAKGVRLGGTSGRLLPWIDDAGERLRMAMGAALSFKTLGRANVVVAYVRPGEVGKAVWRKVLELAGRLELPVIFVVLPAAKGDRRDGMTNLSAKTAGWGAGFDVVQGPAPRAGPAAAPHPGAHAQARPAHGQGRRSGCADR